jgi:hypothetical protein
LSDFAETHFRYDDDPDLPGWKRWQILDQGRFNSFIGALSVKLDGKVAPEGRAHDLPARTFEPA